MAKLSPSGAIAGLATEAAGASLFSGGHGIANRPGSDIDAGPVGVGELAGGVDRGAETPEAIDQPIHDGLGAGPHPPTGELVHPDEGKSPVLRDLLREVVVDPVQPASNPGPFLFVEGAVGGEHVGVTAGAHGGTGDPDSR